MKRLLPLAMLVGVVALPSYSFGYPNGTPMYVTDAAPFCAACHSAVKAAYMSEMPHEAAVKELPENKHYGMVMAPGPTPYAELTDEQKKKVVDDAKKIDANSSVGISAPGKVKAGNPFKVIVKAKGGNGPVIGIMLVDKASRYQSRPIAASGFYIIGEPEVKGQDNQIQKTWLDRRQSGMKKNLNYIVAEKQKLDIDKGIWPVAEVTYTLVAPTAPGAYTIVAAFLYGTENVEKAGFMQRPSGRILFSDEMAVMVE
ncbi:MAG: hypothetical protein HY886_06310 [Deltaproteobacteria bacterium]|nr:hypothetical protein [Deltaproteobacteria bacterium]